MKTVRSLVFLACACAGGLCFSGALPEVPKGYDVLEYIEATGTQYIDSGVSATYDIAIEAEMACTPESATSGLNYSGAVYSGNGGWIAVGSYNQGSLVSYFAKGSREGAGVTIPYDTAYHYYYCGQGNQRIDDQTNTTTAQAFSGSNLNILLFKASTGFGATFLVKQKIKYFNIYEKGVLIRQYVPIRRESDQKVGMYDCCQKQFVANAGTGEFVAGPAVSPSGVVSASYVPHLKKGSVGYMVTSLGGSFTVGTVTLVHSPNADFSSPVVDVDAAPVSLADVGVMKNVIIDQGSVLTNYVRLTVSNAVASSSCETTLVAEVEPPLPVSTVDFGYAELDSLEMPSSGKGAYIDTGVCAAGDLTIELKANTDYTSSGRYFCSGCDAWAKQAFTMRTASGITPVYNTSVKSAIATAAGTHVFKMFPTGFATDGETNLTWTASSFTSTATVYLFGENRGGTHNAAEQVPWMTLYYAKIWKGDELVRDFVPARRLRDDAIGLFDRVGKTFYQNAGTGGFTAGAVTALPASGGLVIRNDSEGIATSPVAGDYALANGAVLTASATATTNTTSWTRGMPAGYTLSILDRATGKWAGSTDYSGASCEYEQSETNVFLLSWKSEEQVLLRVKTFMNGTVRVDGADLKSVAEPWNASRPASDIVVSADYIQLDSLTMSTSGRGAYIDTGVFAAGDLTAEVRATIPLGTSGRYFFSGCNNWVKQAFTMRTEANSKPSAEYANKNYASASAIAAGEHTYVLSPTGYSVDGVSHCSWSEASFTSTSTIFIFGENRGGTHNASEQIGSMTLAYAKIWKGDELVRNFVPAMRRSDLVLGLYDAVNGTFYTNAGTGYFTAGAEVVAGPQGWQLWRAVGAETQLEAVADADSSFNCWYGDVDVAQSQSAAITVTSDRTREVSPVFDKNGVTTTRTWTGLGSSLWNDASSWRDLSANVGLPRAGDVVKLPSRLSAILSTATPTYASVEIAGTLIFTNWTTCLQANTVTITNGGVVTCAGPYDLTLSNRVNIACVDFDLLSGGAVNVSGLGYAASTGPGYYDVNTGVSHGGFGFYSGSAKIPYGNAAKPTTPGSGGRGGAGGGVVAVRATDTVTLAGQILANGGVGGDCKSAGSGGSVLIEADKLILKGGCLTANGGNPGFDYHAGYQNAPGAGGRIALRYSTVERQGAVSFSVQALGGRPYSQSNASNGGYAFATTGADNNSIFNWRAGAGTVWMSDNTLQDEFGCAIAGVIVNMPSVVWTGDHTITNWVGFADDGCTVACAGDLTLDGRDGRLDLGVATNGVLCGKYGYHNGKAAQTLTVAGDLRVLNRARLDVRAASTNAPGQVGASVKVGGRLLISTNSFLRTYCHQISGSVPVFEVGSFALLTNGVVDARWSGWGAGKGLGCNNTPYGNSRQGGSYGGKGGINTSLLVPDGTYGLAERPYYPGSGSHRVPGGGFFSLKTEGTVLVDGNILANGMADGETNGTAASGSGGGILIDCKAFSGCGSLRANASGSSTANHCGCGGGGRIAVYAGTPWNDKYLTRRSRVKWYDAASAAASTEKGFADWTGTAAAAGGVKSNATGASGEDGTVVFGICPDRGLAILIR